MDSKIIQKYKSKTIPVLEKTAIKWFNKFIRLRDCDENGYANCISSGTPLRYGDSNCQAGHFFPAGKYERLRFNENNVHIQGKSDNYFAGANLQEYRKRLIGKIGIEEVMKLEFTSSIKVPFKKDRFFLIEIIEIYKQKCKELSKTKNFKVN